MTVSAILEHQKPSPKPEEFFVPFDADRLRHHLPTLPPGQYDTVEGRLMLLIDRTGYLVAVIGLMAAICAVTDETAGVVADLPVAIWLLFEQVPGRPLP